MPIRHEKQKSYWAGGANRLLRFDRRTLWSSYWGAIDLPFGRRETVSHVVGVVREQRSHFRPDRLSNRLLRSSAISAVLVRLAERV